VSLPSKLLALLFALLISAGMGYRAGVKLTQSDTAKATITAIEAARTEEQQNAKRVQTAQSNQVAKLRIVERDSAGTLFELASLRDALRAKPAGDITIAALAERTNTLGKLLDSCSAEYQSVARSADGHSLDVVTLRDAWPR
jgi:hypothetical protein